MEHIIPTAAIQAYVVLALFPLVIIFLFNKLPLQQALIWSMVSAYLLLPAGWVVNFDAPVIPPLEKATLPAIVAAIMCYMVLRKADQHNRHSLRRTDMQKVAIPALPGWLPRSFLGMSLLALLFISIPITILSNSDTLFYGPVVLPGLSPYEIMSVTLNTAMFLLPLLLGRKFLADDAGHLHLLKIICISAVVYGLLALIEVRLSPQINRTVYGFFPHSWVQHLRADGFRPIVFLDHGLLLGIYLAFAVLCTATLVRLTSGTKRMLYIGALIYLMGVLFLAKTLGAFVIAVLLVPLALLLPARIQLIAAGVIAAITLTYPMLRGGGMVPTEQILEVAERIDESRAASLRFRFENEDILLEKASERPLFGWGIWGRWRVFDEFGEDLSVSDGEWAIVIGEYGWAGYIARFGLFCIPLIMLAVFRRRYAAGLATTGLSMAIAANLVDLIPNASVTPVLLLAAGGLLGRLELKAEAVQDTGRAVPVASRAHVQRQRLRYGGLGTADGMAQPADGVIALDGEEGRYARFPHRHTRQK